MRLSPWVSSVIVSGKLQARSSAQIPQVIMEETTRWLVGLDLIPENTGVFRVSSWLRASEPEAQAIGVHVVETGLFRFLGERVPTILAGARERIDEAVAEAGGGVDLFAKLEAVSADTAERGLMDAAIRHGARALLIGRWSRRGERSVVKLGRVARRILRALPVPVIVTPPDLLRSDIGAGPILLATDLSANSAAAARFAVDLAERTARPLVVAYVGIPRSHAALYVLDEEMEGLIEGHKREVEAAARAWASANLPGDPEVKVAFGEIESELLGLAEGLSASMIVCGSRGLSLAERIFASSTASNLAGLAPCPVAVVPSGENGQS